MCPGLSALGGLMNLQSAHDIFICPKVDPKFPKSCSMELVELEEHEGSKPAWGSPLGVGWRILWRVVAGAVL